MHDHIHGTEEKTGRTGSEAAMGFLLKTVSTKCVSRNLVREDLPEPSWWLMTVIFHVRLFLYSLLELHCTVHAFLQSFSWKCVKLLLIRHASLMFYLRNWHKSFAGAGILWIYSTGRQANLLLVRIGSTQELFYMKHYPYFSQVSQTWLPLISVTLIETFLYKVNVQETAKKLICDYAGISHLQCKKLHNNLCEIFI